MIRVFEVLVFASQILGSNTHLSCSFPVDESHELDNCSYEDGAVACSVAGLPLVDQPGTSARLCISLTVGLQNLHVFEKAVPVDLDRPRPAACKRRGVWLSVDPGSLVGDCDALQGLPEDVRVRHLRLSCGSWDTLTRAQLHLPELAALDLSWNRIANVEKDAFANIRSLEYLSLAHNDLMVVPEGISTLGNLKCLDISNNPISYQHSTFREPLGSVQWLVLASTPLRTLGHIRPWLLTRQLVGLDVSHCDLQEIPEHDVALLSLQSSLQFLNLSRNRIQIVPPSLTASLTSLRVLDLSHNDIFTAPKLNMGTTLLKVLDLSWNKLRHPGNIVAHGIVEYLDLSWNNIAPWSDMDIFMRPHSDQKPWVRMLNLSHNKIASVSVVMCHTLSILDEVDLGETPLGCHTKDWLKEFNPTHFLGSDNEFDHSSVTNCSNSSSCTEDPAVIIVIVVFSLLGFTILILLCVCACYGGRFEASYLLYLLHIRRQWDPSKGTRANKFQYDAFVCYCEEDRDWVLGTLVRHLEEGPERYRLCLSERDFPAGSFIIHNIIQAIQNSRNTIVVLSDPFIKSQMCCWQLEQINGRLMDNHRQSLILFKLQQLDRRPLPRHIKYLMDTRTYLEWSSTAALQAGTWKRLEVALGKSHHCLRLRDTP